MVDAEEAFRMGLVERLVEGSAVHAAQEYVRELAATVSPSSLADTKRMVWEHAGMTIEASLDDVWEIQAASLERPDLAEGVASFVEKRPPHFPRLEGR
jgi:enoyl-CoA hydratase/carnithine racemase